MVKIIFEDVEKSFYDDATGIVHMRKDLLNPDKSGELEQVLQHELDHYYLGKSRLNLAYDFIADNAFKWWKIPFFLLLLGVMVYGQYWLLPGMAFNSCKQALEKTSLDCYGIKPNGSLPFNFTGNFTISDEKPNGSILIDER